MGRAETLRAPALLGIALALRAVGAAGREDSRAVLVDAGRAVVLVEDASLPALDRCTAMVVCAAAYNTLALWELADELFDRASDLAPACEEPLQQPAVTVNRVLLRLEWATALLELGEERAALDQLHRPATRPARRRRRPAAEDCGGSTCWPRDLVPSCFGVSGTDDGAAASTTAGRARRAPAALVAIEDVEMLPLLDALVGARLLRLGRGAEARARLRPAGARSASSGARSFPAWVRAQVLADAAGATGPRESVDAHREYGVPCPGPGGPPAGRCSRPPAPRSPPSGSAPSTPCCPATCCWTR